MHHVQVFGPVWSALYTAMGYSSYLVWKSGGGAVPLTLYGIQLALNLAWSPLFFKQHEIGFALADITGAACLPACSTSEHPKLSVGT